MPLYRLPTVVVGPEGAPLANCAVEVRAADGAPTALWEDAAGAVSLGQGARTDDAGAVAGWAAAGSYAVSVRQEGATIVTGASFRLGPLGERKPLPLCRGWSDYPGYAPSTYAGDRERGVEVTCVLKAADETGGCAATPFARLPEELAPAGPIAVPAIVGVVTPAGVEVRVDAVIALPDGHLRAPNQPCRWLSLLAPIGG